MENRAKPSHKGERLSGSSRAQLPAEWFPVYFPSSAADLASQQFSFLDDTSFVRISHFGYILSNDTVHTISTEALEIKYNNRT